jgi:redox-sensitive bicupin YhaK (pirin superfamily)
MLEIRRSSERGNANHGWLRSNHTFSFAEYFDPKFMGFGAMRVINEDRIAGGKGFGAHPHRDMEIVSYVVSGALEHNDSMGTKAVIRPGEVQRMSAGTGVTHSEMNHEKDSETHFFQIWILPKKEGLEPGYGQKDFSEKLTQSPLVLAVSETGQEGSVTINQDVEIYIGKVKAGEKFTLPLQKERLGWVQLIDGSMSLGDSKISKGDGLSITDAVDPVLQTSSESHFLFFNLPKIKE